MKLVIKDKFIDIKESNSFIEKLKGFMLKKDIKYGLRFKKCNSIHTFFMFEKIDVIMTDKNNKIIYIKNNLKRNRIILPKFGVYYTYEIPAGYNTYKIGDTLKLTD